MVLAVVKPGALATLQGSVRHGLRHQGIPGSGPADALSRALANRLVGNVPDATAIEITFGGAVFEFREDAIFSFAGACGAAELSGALVAAHETQFARRGDSLVFVHPPAGARTYLAVAGGIRADNVFGSASTFLPAAFGGYSGRALRSGDILEAPGVAQEGVQLVTPEPFRPHMSRTHSLRAVPGPDYDELGPAAWSETFPATNRMDRTGLELSGPWPRPENGAQKLSAALFPGAVQLTPSGKAFVLLPDAQTTGGYPHVLQVIRADRHLLGQIAPGDRLRFLRRSVDEAYSDLLAKTRYFAEWLPAFRF
ncbi:MAG: hypothetical protein CVT79_03955 [Alphaproteobacteria bacterium HGW-Alphaproteobacteria-18]|nr:MAG: hypothetical protein CVT79_03955 [Alphaproteobacteria bacterium HGW-Alphaproteobacteria-18]